MHLAQKSKVKQKNAAGCRSYARETQGVVPDVFKVEPTPKTVSIL